MRELNFEPIVGAIISAEIEGVYQTPEGKWTLLAADSRRFRTSEDVIGMGSVDELGWRVGNVALVTLTTNTAGRVTKVERNG